jgi:hypothetical protein
MLVFATLNRFQAFVLISIAVYASRCLLPKFTIASTTLPTEAYAVATFLLEPRMATGYSLDYRVCDHCGRDPSRLRQPIRTRISDLHAQNLR